MYKDIIVAQTKFEKEEKIKDFDKRLGCWQVAFAVFAIGLIVHLFFIQVIDVKKLRIKAKNQRLASSFVMRGDIYDRNGIKLASDKVLFDVYARTPDYEHTPEELANILGIGLENMMVAGDSDNDKHMFLPEVFKVAVDNAIPSLKELADYIAPSNDNDGVAETVRMVSVPLPPRIVTAMGTSTPNVPQDVPVANAIAPASTKKIAGNKNFGNELFARLFCTNACASRKPPFAPIIPDNDQAKVKIKIAGTIALKPSVKLPVISLKLNTPSTI